MPTPIPFDFYSTFRRPHSAFRAPPARDILLIMADHFRTCRRVEFCDTDLAGIVHFANFYRYMEQAEHALFRALGLKIHGIGDDGVPYGWPRVASSCSHRLPARYEDVIEIVIEIVRRSPRSLTTAYRFYKESELIAEGEMKTAFCRIPPGAALQSAEMPPAIAQPLDDLMARTEPLLDPERF